MQPSVEHDTISQRFWSFELAVMVMCIEVCIILFITRRYSKKARQMEKPERSIAKRELGWLLAYFVGVQLFGVLVGHLLGQHAISFHLAGSMYGTHDHIGLAEMLTWSGYNFLFYVIVPILYLVKRCGYSLRQLNIISTRNVRRDILVIVIVLCIETFIQLAGASDAILHLSLHQILVGGLLAFLFNFFGTALPTALFIYALLFPRYQAVFKSPVLIIVLGGLTYMAAHMFESWMIFTSLGAFAVSLGALFLQYFMPGVIKSVLTYRTGNPWVHLWAYHAIAPHVVLDTPHFVESFDIQR